MADQGNRAFRGGGYPDQRGASSGNGDPLADLARLIGGQNDPFAGSAPRHADNSGEWRPSADGFDPPDPRLAAASSDYPEPFPPSADPHGHEFAGQGFEPPRGYRQPPAGYEAQPRSFAPPPYADQGQGYGSDPYYAEHDDEYDDNVPARRRGGMLTVMAVVALGLIGTAGAFGYKAIFGNSGSSAPPVIKADTTPAKIVPATTADAKQSYDRVGDRSQPEKVVSREEKPVDINDALRAPRVVGGNSANPIAPSAAPQIPANASALVAPTGSGAPTTAPKRVRTVTIKQDGPDAEAPVARSAAPIPVTDRAPVREVEPVAAPRAPRVVTTTRTQTAAADPNAPLSLAPPSSSPSRSPTMRTASAPAAPRAAVSENGAYVQISSQRSETEAQSAFRSLQSKFPGQLGGQQPIIRRADLGDKGIYYRVQVGPFSSSEQASELCGSLKNAGGQCVVQRN